MTVIRTRTFKSGNSQAVRLPKSVGFGPGTEVEVAIQGDVVTLRPARLSPAELVAALNMLPSPGEIEVRDVEELPERKGL